MIQWIGTAAVALVVGVGWFTGAVATELAPWFGRTMEFELRTSYGYGWYDNVDVGSGVARRPSDDNYFNMSLALSPLARWAGELEVLTVGTTQRGFGYAHTRATLRYLVANDCIGDPFSVVTGISVTFPEASARRDLSLGYHGEAETDGHLAFGKELICNACWLVRHWSVVGIGYAGGGSPWGYLETNIDALRGECHQFRAFLRGVAGGGEHDLTLPPAFRNYDGIEHRSVDWGIGYGYVVGCWGTLNVDYTHRVHASNYPENAHLVTVGFLFPFGI